MAFKNHKPQPTRWANKLLHIWADPESLEEIQGDMLEMYTYWAETQGKSKATRRYIFNVLKLSRPFAKRKKFPKTTSISHLMISSYFKIAFRSLLKNKGYSAINIFVLATGMAVAIMIGLWIYDELSFNKSYKNYDRIAQVMQHSMVNGTYETISSLPVPLATELKTTYGNEFKYVVLASIL